MVLVAGAALTLAWPATSPAQLASSLTVSRPSVTEGNSPTPAAVVIRRTGLLLPPVRLRVQTADGTAKAPWDYTPVDGYVTLPGLVSGSQSVTVNVIVRGDLVLENYEYLNVRVEGVPSTLYPGGVSIDDTPDPPLLIDRAYLTKYSPPQQLLSRAADGGPPNAPATEPVLSWDARTTRYAAYTSAATNIASGASNGKRNVFLVKRGGVPGRFGSPWEYGSTALASVGRGGQSANGDSWSPALSGWTHVDDARGAACLAFASRASNLVHGDRNGRADLFVKRLPGGKLKRIAAPRGRLSSVAIAGDCHSTAMVAAGSLFVTRTGAKPRRVARGGVRSPRLTYNGSAISYTKRGTIYAQRIGRRARRVAKGTGATSDGGRTSSSPPGDVRAVAYERGSAVYQRTLGRKEHLISLGGRPSMTAGAAQTMFAYGPFVYMYATSNNYGKRPPQGFCPEGTVNEIATSARANYVAFACKGDAIYLSYIGPK